MKAIPMIGRKFGLLTVTEARGVTGEGTTNKQFLWLCRCDCGSEKIAKGSKLVHGNTKSCGCLVAMTNNMIRRGEPSKLRTHGEASISGRSPEYVTWLSMRQRCNDPNHSGYAGYGARGIRVCDDWAHSFETFLKDMGRKPSPLHSIDRINPQLGYSAENCRWADAKMQGGNKTNSKRIVFAGGNWAIGDLAAHLNVPRSTLERRIAKLRDNLIDETAAFLPGRSHAKLRRPLAKLVPDQPAL